MLWGQRSSFLHGGKLKDPGWLNKRAMEWLEEFVQVQEQFAVTLPRETGGNVWRPPPHPFFKMNFDAAIFSESEGRDLGL